MISLVISELRGPFDVSQDMLGGRYSEFFGCGSAALGPLRLKFRIFFGCGLVKSLRAVQRGVNFFLLR